MIQLSIAELTREHCLKTFVGRVKGKRCARTGASSVVYTSATAESARLLLNASTRCVTSKCTNKCACYPLLDRRLYVVHVCRLNHKRLYMTRSHCERIYYHNRALYICIHACACSYIYISVVVQCSSPGVCHAITPSTCPRITMYPRDCIEFQPVLPIIPLSPRPQRDAPINHKSQRFIMFSRMKSTDTVRF